MRVQEKLNGKFSVENQLEATIGYYPKLLMLMWEKFLNINS